MRSTRILDPFATHRKMRVHAYARLLAEYLSPEAGHVDQASYAEVLELVRRGAERELARASRDQN